MDAIKHICAYNGWLAGRTGFVKGHVPPNKGKKGVGPWNGKEFTKGHKSGASKPVGAEMINVDGCLLRKIHDEPPTTPRWRKVHIMNWEAVHGPIPNDHCLKCLDGNKLNTYPSNWKLIHWGVLGHLARRYDSAPAELRQTVMARGGTLRLALTRRPAAAAPTSSPIVSLSEI